MDYILLVIVSIIAIPVMCFSLEVVASLLNVKKIYSKTKEEPNLVVIIPAHDESGTIDKTLKNLKKHMPVYGSMLVIADNCTDDTAFIAKNLDVKVIERNDPQNRGKGFALDYGIEYLRSSPPDVVVFIDADCRVKYGTLQNLAHTAIALNRPVQASYFMRFTKPSLKQRISEFAWIVKNYVRPLGLSNIGLPCQLTGTGMAFPWELISKAELASNNIVEDMKLGLDMTMIGYAPVFLQEASVISSFPESSLAEESQKKRWEHGHLNMIIHEFPKLFLKGILSLSKEKIALALDLCVPPLALLTIGIVTLFILTGIFSIFSGSYEAFFISAITLSTFCLSVFISWYKWARSVVSFKDLLKVPFYIASKIPIYVSAIFNQQKDWIRTDRD